MKKKWIIVIVVIFLCIWIMIYKKQHPFGDLSETVKIELTYYDHHYEDAGETEVIKFYIVAPETLEYICENLTSVTWNEMTFTNKPTETKFTLKFLDEEENEIEYISISAHDWIDFPRKNSHYYYAVKGALDRAYLEKIVAEYRMEQNMN